MGVTDQKGREEGGEREKRPAIEAKYVSARPSVRTSVIKKVTLLSDAYSSSEHFC